jgi:hypothetical protein
MKTALLGPVEHDVCLLPKTDPPHGVSVAIFMHY